MFNQQSIHPLDVGMGIPLAVMVTYGLSTPQHEIPPQIEYIQTNPQTPIEYGAHGGPPPMQMYNTPNQNRQYYHVGSAPHLGPKPVNNPHDGRPVQGPGMNANSGL